VKSDFLIALTQLVAERHLPRDQVVRAIEAALVSAFKKDSTAVGQNISVRLDPTTGELAVFALKTVVADVEDPQHEIGLTEAASIKADAVIGEEVETLELSHQASRIAAQTAKQVVLQRLREAEREKTFQEFQERTGEIVSGVVDQIEPGRVIIFDLGRVEGILHPEDQVPTERYRKGQRIKVLVLEVLRTSKGPEILISRTHKDLLRRLFEVEVPEVFNGVVEIKAVAREPGYRSKVAVASSQDGVDPVGSCIGMRGNRIQSIVNELQGEKIDIVRWDKSLKKFISNALSPAEVSQVIIDENERSATIVVPERHLSLAIGKEGQNARLAAKLTNLHLDIKGMAEWEALRLQQSAVEAEVKEITEAIPVTPGDHAEAGEVADLAIADALEPTEQVLAPTMENMVAEVLADEVSPDSPSLELESPIISPEEETLSQVLEEEEEEEEQEEPGLLMQDVIWESPIVTPDAGKIRFAEDFADEVRGGRGRGRRRSRAGNVASRRRGPAPGPAPRPSGPASS
jgi:N utilization substance protein A